MENSENMILNQALELSASECANVAEKLLISLDRPDSKLMFCGQKKQTPVSGHIKKVKLKLPQQKRSLLSIVKRESKLY